MGFFLNDDLLQLREVAVRYFTARKNNVVSYDKQSIT